MMVSAITLASRIRRLKPHKAFSTNSNLTNNLKVPQAPNRASAWSNRQRQRAEAIVGPRFVNVNLTSQPKPEAAIELLKQQPIVSIKSRTIACDGGGLLGHPKVFINLVRSDISLI